MFRNGLCPGKRGKRCGLVGLYAGMPGRDAVYRLHRRYPPAAGGYPTWTVAEGIFKVKNIEFINNASLGVNGGMYNGDTTPTKDTINIEGCTFRGQLDTYHNDAATTPPETDENPRHRRE